MQAINTTYYFLTGPRVKMLQFLKIVSVRDMSARVIESWKAVFDAVVLSVLTALLLYAHPNSSQLAPFPDWKRNLLR